MRAKTVLVVDDRAPTREGYAPFLIDSGYRVLEAAHGGAAILQAHLHRPDVVLLDIGMPVLSGVETAESLRAYPPTASIRIVAVTASGSPRERERMRSVCDALLDKPCDPQVIAGSVRSLTELPLLMSQDDATTGKRILLVEDNEDHRSVFELALRCAGFSVITCGDGEGAVLLARMELPDLILMDLSLPVLDGWEAARRLKADGRTRPIPIVALTAHVFPGARKRAEEAGFDSYLTKPITPTALAESAAMLLGVPGTFPRFSRRCPQ